MLRSHDDDFIRKELRELEARVRSVGPDLALFLVFDRPDRVKQRPGLRRTYFEQRCVSEDLIENLIEAFRAVGAYVELFDGEQPFLDALTSGRLSSIDRRLKVVYNGIEGGISFDGFKPGRKALIPSVCDSYEITFANSNAYACALGRHKFHYFTVLSALGVMTPGVWHYRLGLGWAAGREPEPGTRVIIKSTFESWSVGVTDTSVFTVDDRCEDRVRQVAERIGQSATVQQFVSGPEVCVSVFSGGELLVPPPIEAILTKSPRDGDAVTTIDDNLQAGGVLRERYRGTEETLGRLVDASKKSFDLLELDGFARIDFRVDSAGDPWVTDVGVSPGLAPGGSSFNAVAELGFSYPEFLRLVVGANLDPAECRS